MCPWWNEIKTGWWEETPRNCRPLFSFLLFFVPSQLTPSPHPLTTPTQYLTEFNTNELGCVLIQLPRSNANFSLFSFAVTWFPKPSKRCDRENWHNLSSHHSKISMIVVKSSLLRHFVTLWCGEIDFWWMWGETSTIAVLLLMCIKRRNRK